jgi:phosphatidylglycerol:prolipoprotein diacylglycerol transferase
MVFPNGGPLARHPSQLYEAALEGLALYIILQLLIKAKALHRPGLITGVFFLGYAFARQFVEFFRQPDAHLGILSGGMTMGQWLSIPMVLIGVFLIVKSVRQHA